MPVTCPIGRPDASIHSHSGTLALTMTCIGTALAAHSNSLLSNGSAGQRLAAILAGWPTTRGQ